MAARVVEMLLGVWLLAAPEFVGYDGAARVSHLVVAPIAASIAATAAWEVLRELRWLNLALGAWLVLSPLLIPHDQLALGVGVMTGMAMTALALVRGQVNDRLGGGWRAVVRPATDNTADEGGSHDRSA